MKPRAPARTGVIAALAFAVASAPVLAQSAEGQPKERAPAAVTLDVFASTDADETEVVRTGINFDWFHAGDDRYQGIRL